MKKQVRCRRECCLSGKWAGRSKRYIISVPEIYLNFDGAEDQIPKEVQDQIYRDLTNWFKYTNALLIEREPGGIVIHCKVGDVRSFVPTMVKTIKEIIRQRLDKV